MYNTTGLFSGNRGAGLLEVMLSLAIIAMATPFVYSQINETNHNIADIATARKIMSVRGAVLNFIRMNQHSWPDVAQIKMDENELSTITPDAVAGFIDKYQVSGATITDVYLAFPGAENDIHTTRIARHIGADAAIVGTDGVAYGNTWAVAAPDFESGYLIYRITRDIEGEDRSKYLHRGTSGEDELNVMMRDLNMGGYNILDVGTITAASTKITNANTTFVETDDIISENTYFSDGANMDGGNVSIGALRVTGDVTGFRNIYAARLNNTGYGTSGRVIVDRATIENSVNVSRNLELKSSTSRTISGFAGIHTNAVITSYISAEEIIFYEDFGLTVSGELMYSTTAPIKIGAWTWPSFVPPSFAELTFDRATLPDAPSRGEFGPLMISGWKSIQPAGGTQ